MQVNARTDYALRAVIEIGDARGVVRKRDLSGSQDIPARFLEQILAQLVRSGVLVATRGPAGGYALARAADAITVADVVRAIDGPLAAVRGMPPENVEYEGKTAVLREMWVALRASMRDVLEETTIADLVAGELPAAVTEMLDRPGAWRRRSTLG